MVSWKDFFSATTATTTESRYYRERAEYYFALGVFLFGLTLVFFLLSGVDALGLLLISVLTGFLLLLGGYHLWRARRASAASVVYLNPALAPPPVQVAYYRRLMLLLAVLFPALTALTAWDLHQLETGQVQRITLDVPLNFIYGRFGFWPTVLSIPACGLLLLLVLQYGVAKARLKQQQEEEARQAEAARRE